MKPHPHVPRNVNALHTVEQATAGFNQRLAIAITKAVGTMPCAYLFLFLAILGFPGLHATIQAYVQWFSQTCLQLVFLPVLSVGQAVLSRHAELMAEEQFNTTTKICSDVEQIMTHLSKREGAANGSEETKVRDDKQAQKRSNSPVGRSGKDEAGATSEASEITLEQYLNQCPEHPLARETEKWIASMGKTLRDVIWWEIRDGAPIPHLHKASVSLQFRGSATRHYYTFRYSDLELLEEESKRER